MSRDRLVPDNAHGEKRALKPTPDISIDSNLRSPRYAQVYAALRDWILQGVYTPGERLPSESEFCDLFKVSRITVRSAIEMLEKERMVQRVQGRGTFVSKHISNSPTRGDLSELVRKLRQLDARSNLADLSIRTEPSEEAISRDLQLDPGEEVVHASYVRLRDDEPVGVADIYVPKRLGVELTEEDMHGPSPILLESKGIEILGAHQLIGASLADGQVASKLGVPIGSPLVLVRLLVLELSSKPVELLQAHYRADKYMHHVFLAARSVQAPTKAR
ncbi:MAG: GntR family transcriptional regulator [Hyphomonadaceae bacterium]